MAAQGEAVALRHASLLSIAEADSFTLVQVADPWQKGGAGWSYVLVPAAYRQLPSGLPAGTVVRTPLKRIVAGAAVHAALMADLGAVDALAALCDVDYVVGAPLKQLCASGRVENMGSSMRLDVERVRHSKADALWLSPFENANYGPVEHLGVPIIQCADYMETTALGRAEWMRFYGRLVGRAATADSLFAEVEKAYTAVQRRAAKAKHRPRVMADLKEGAAWLVPGGRSTMGQMFADAGADYLWAYRHESGSLQLDFESVFSRAVDADIWLIKYGANVPISYTSLATDFPLYQRFKPWRTHQIYTCNTLRVPFYEEVPFHPDRLLENLYQAFQEGKDGRYYKRLK